MNTNADYDLTLKIRNAPLLNMMRSAGYETVAALSRDCGIHQTIVGNMLNLKKPAYCKDGYTPLPTAKKLADFFGVGVDFIFPEAHLRSPLIQNKFNAQITGEQMEQLTNQSVEDPARLLEVMETESRDVFYDIIGACKSLTDREKNVLECRFNRGMTLKETGKLFDVSTDRARQIEADALRKMRRAVHRKNILDAGGIYSEPFEHDYEKLTKVQAALIAKKMKAEKQYDSAQIINDSPLMLRLFGGPYDGMNATPEKEIDVLLVDGGYYMQHDSDDTRWHYSERHWDLDMKPPEFKLKRLGKLDESRWQ